jgi:hypothetical protein
VDAGLWSRPVRCRENGADQKADRPVADMLELC